MPVSEHEYRPFIAWLTYHALYGGEYGIAVGF